VKKKYLGIVLTAALSLPSLGLAEGMYGGLQYGTLTSEDADMGNLGISIGSSINDFFSIEGSYTFTVNEEDLGNNVTLSADSIGLFAVVKSEGDFYGKAKVGLAKVDFEMESGGNSLSDDANGLALGLAVGVKAGQGAVEVEYTKLPDLDDFSGVPVDASNDYLSVGFVFNF